MVAVCLVEQVGRQLSGRTRFGRFDDELAFPLKIAVDPKVDRNEACWNVCGMNQANQTCQSHVKRSSTSRLFSS